MRSHRKQKQACRSSTRDACVGRRLGVRGCRPQTPASTGRKRESPRGRAVRSHGPTGAWLSNRRLGARQCRRPHPGDCESGGLSGNAARPGSARLCCAYARRWDRTGAAARMLLVHRDRQVGVDGDACSSEDAAVVSGSASRVSGCSRTRRCIAQACGVCASSSCVGVRGCVACVAKGPSGCGGPSLAGIRVLAVTASGRRTVPGRVCPCRRFRSGRGSRSADRGPGTRVRGMSVPRSGGVCSCRPRSGVRSGADRGPGARVRGTFAPRSGVAGTGRRWRRPGVPGSGRGSRSGSLRPSRRWSRGSRPRRSGRRWR